MTTKVTSWSPSRYVAYQNCPLRFKLERIDKRCPLCFKGSLVGFDNPKCDTCHGEPGTPDAIARGNVIHKAMELYITGATGKLTADVTPPFVPKTVANLAKTLRERFKKGLVRVEHDLVFADGWTPTGKFTKGAWLRTKVDVLDVYGNVVDIIDWKSGGIDKKTKEVRAEDKYDDEMEIYGMAVLHALPTAEVAKPRLVFVDGPAGRHEKTRDEVKRKDLVKLRKKWDGKIKPMFSDTVFAPRPGNCKFCPFQKSGGGPCPY